MTDYNEYRKTLLTKKRWVAKDYPASINWCAAITGIAERDGRALTSAEQEILRTLELRQNEYETKNGERVDKMLGTMMYGKKS